MRKKWLIAQPACEAPESIMEDIACKAQILKREENDPFTWVLNVDVFAYGALRARYFADKYMDEYAAYFVNKRIWRQTNLLNTIDIAKLGFPDSHMANGYWRFGTTGRSKFDKDEDYRIAEDYFGRGLTDWEWETNLQKRRKAFNRKIDRIDALMAKVPEAPADLEPWIRRKAFSEEYIMQGTRKDGLHAYCTACGEEWMPEKRMALGRMYQCPACRRSLKVKGAAAFRKPAGVIVLQPFLGNWIERIFRAVAHYEFGTRPQIELYEEIRITIPKGETWGKVYYGQHGEADETMQDWLDTNSRNKRFRKGFLYTENLESLKGFAPDSLFHSGILELAEQGQFDVNKFIYSYEHRPYQEYLIKGRFYHLCRDMMDIYTYAGRGQAFVQEPSCMNASGKTVTEVLRLDKNRVNRLRVRNGGIHTLEWLQFDQWDGYKVTDEALDFFTEAGLTVNDLRELVEETGSITKVMNYIRKQEYKPSTFISYWKDYLRMARGEGYDITDSIVRFPKNLKLRHDQLLEVIEERRFQEQLEARKERNKEVNAGILKQLPKGKYLYWENEHYMFIPAGTAEELEEEGRALHHCVGSSPVYKEKMARGESWIVFLRKKENLQKAYYTIEVNLSDNKILQYYSEFDRQPDKKEIDKLLTEYKNHLKKTKKPVREVVVDINPGVLAAAM